MAGRDFVAEGVGAGDSGATLGGGAALGGGVEPARRWTARIGMDCGVDGTVRCTVGRLKPAGVEVGRWAFVASGAEARWTVDGSPTPPRGFAGCER
ncbi:hypothetical protein [Catenulispora sp. GAS73]|uniref:hypothetical protein n=1 Tax=Catenulispora sp. GAS73 TaxID=3156269 RepID=UPI0035148195